MIVELTASEIDELLRGRSIGRVGCHADGVTYVVPVIYVWDGECVYVQSIEGQKIRMMRQNPRVCFEVDEHEERDGSWRSVIMQGHYDELAGPSAQRALGLLVERFTRRRGDDGEPPAPPPGGRQPVTFRIRPLELTGRGVSRSPGEKAVTRA